MHLLQLPSPDGTTEEVVWTGKEFVIGGLRQRVLCYDGGSGNWTDELTSFHEDVAGENHAIDLASRRFAIQSIRSFVESKDPVVMDVGCSSGFLLPALRDALPNATVLGADYVRGPLEELGRKLSEVPLLQFDLTRCPLPESSVDAVTLLNVLEHIEDDAKALAQVYRVLRRRGIAVLEVPAGPDLYDVYDKQLMHFRRYDMAAFIGMVEKAGFQIRKRSHLGFFAYPAFRMVKKRNQVHLNAPDSVQREIVARSIATSRSNILLRAAFALEDALRPFVPYPAGIRCLVVAQKP